MGGTGVVARRSDAALEHLLCLALTAPDRLSRSSPGIIGSNLDASLPDRRRILALRALAAVAYARSDLVRPSLAGALARTMAAPVSNALAISVGEAFQWLATSAAAPAAVRALTGLLGRRLPTAARDALLAALSAYARWRPDLVRLGPALRAAGATPDGPQRELILREVVERRLSFAPRAVTPAVVDRLLATFGNGRRLPYALAGLAAGGGAPLESNAQLQRWLAPQHPLRHTAAGVLGAESFAVLAVHNIADGQGDEVVRVVPLVQALLEANPSLTVVVLTRRVYLYDHPRVTPVYIHDDRAVDRVLRSRFDGVVDWNARTVPGVSGRPELAARIGAYIAGRPVPLVIRGVTGPAYFSFETVRIRDRSVARLLGLDRTAVQNVYDATERLLIELGLPVPGGPSRAGSLLVAAPSGEARAAWRRLRGRAGRPVALVNAFGGRLPLKGFTADRTGRLAAEIGGLIDEGFAVVLLPSREPWAGAEVVAATLRHLEPARRSRLAVGPDPTGVGAGLDAASAERPELSAPDRVMRLFKYFASYSDLVVTVEGWLMHFAYAMGRPFRLVMAPRSAFDWVPPRLGPHQRLVTSMSPLCAPDTEDLLGHDDLPPRPSHPRKPMLVAAVRALADMDSAEADRLLLRVLASPDAGLRVAAVEAIGRRRPISSVKGRLIEALADAANTVRAAAARALLASGADCARKLGPTYRAQLEAHAQIADQNWQAVEALGPSMLPALAAATRDENDVIRREAQWIAARLIVRARGGRETAPRDLDAI